MVEFLTLANKIIKQKESQNALNSSLWWLIFFLLTHLKNGQNNFEWAANLQNSSIKVDFWRHWNQKILYCSRNLNLRRLNLSKYCQRLNLKQLLSEFYLDILRLIRFLQKLFTFFQPFKHNSMSRVLWAFSFFFLQQIREMFYCQP